MHRCKRAQIEQVTLARRPKGFVSFSYREEKSWDLHNEREERRRGDIDTPRERECYYPLDSLVARARDFYERNERAGESKAWQGGCESGERNAGEGATCSNADAPSGFSLLIRSSRRR